MVSREKSLADCDLIEKYEEDNLNHLPDIGKRERNKKDTKKTTEALPQLLVAWSYPQPLSLEEI